jgi:MYXO-CTERM domain-containing protein
LFRNEEKIMSFLTNSDGLIALWVVGLALLVAYLMRRRKRKLF